MIDECAGDSRKLFRIVNFLSEERQVRDLPNENPLILANRFGEFFYEKIELVKAEFDKVSVDPPHVDFRFPSEKLESFSLLSEDEVRKIVMQSLNASSQLDPIPTWLVKICCDELTPVITKMVNLSISEGIVPDCWKTALVRPLLKKLGLELLFENFRPISNLPFVAKSVEKAVIPQLSTHCAANAPFPEKQSAYREKSFYRNSITKSSK